MNFPKLNKVCQVLAARADSPERDECVLDLLDHVEWATSMNQITLEERKKLLSLLHSITPTADDQAS